MAQYQSSLTGPQIDAALRDMANHDSEAWAVGTRDGAAVSSLDVTYHNNSQYYSNRAINAAARAEAAVPAGTSGAVFFDQAQTLTDSQKAQARTNIGAQKNNSGNATGISSLADLKAQMSAWYTAQGKNSQGYYTVSLSGTVPPFSAGAHITVQINSSDYTKYGTAIITRYTSSAGAAVYAMSYFNGSWTDPKQFAFV